MPEDLMCDEHGKMRATYTCGHVLQTVADGRARGLHWIVDDDGDIQAFCAACWDATDDAWDAMTDDERGPRVLCLECLKSAAAANGVEIGAG